MAKKSNVSDNYQARPASAIIAFLIVLSTSASAQTSIATGLAPATFSSSLDEHSELPAAPEIPYTSASLAKSRRAESPGYRATRPFRSLAVGLTLGSGGIGFDLATPINSKFNLRGGAGFLNYTTSFAVDTIPIDGTLHLASAAVAVDYFPSGRSFHITPGITFHNNTTYNALIFIPGNQIVTLNGEDYTSDPADPIHGTAFIKFGNRVAPRLTVGWGNVIRHTTNRFTFPVDLGIEYIQPPTASFTLTGSSCDNIGLCGPIQYDPSTQQNILEQQQEIVNDLRPLRFFPILSVGISYKFGH